MPRLLLVEDNQHIQRIYAEKFIREGFEVTTAGNGEDGLSAAQAQPPDIILLDIMLPKLSGFDVLARLRESDRLAQVPVFMLSNRAWPDDVQRALLLGARQFYTKGSSTLQQIVQQIRADLGLKKVAIVSRHATTAHPIARVLAHPQILCSTLTVLAERLTALQRDPPNLLVLDARPPATQALTVLHQLRASPQMAEVAVVAITDQPLAGARVEKILPGHAIDTELLPAALQLLGLGERQPAATA
jgi:two-component system alkaline phosphatase synthesis response regulator PhoP/two-component system response regulator VicR